MRVLIINALLLFAFTWGTSLMAAPADCKNANAWLASDKGFGCGNLLCKTDSQLVKKGYALFTEPEEPMQFACTPPGIGSQPNPIGCASLYEQYGKMCAR